MTPGEVTNGGEATLLALGARAIWEVTIGANGMGAVTGTTPLAPGADAVAIECGRRPLDLSDANSPLPCRGSLVFVLDRASEAVLVFEPKPDGSLAQKSSLAVGSRPSAFVLADINEDAHDDIAVANEGSDDVSVVLGRDDGGYAPQRRIAVGARPRDIVAGEFDSGFGRDLAVADSGTGSISFLLGDNHGAFARRDVVVGGSPTALLADSSDDDWLDLDGKGLPDLVVADATAGTVGVLLARRDALPRLASRVSLPGGAASEPVALRQIDGLGGEGNHLLVAARGTGEVLDIPVSDTGALGAAGSVLSGAQPVALDVRYDLTADAGEDALAADGSGALRSLVASPSRIVEQRRGAANVAAGDGLVVWSQRVGSRRHRVRIADRSGVRDLPQSTSRRRLTPRVGRATDGTTVVTYLRCGAHQCTPWVWRVAERRARRLQIPTARGCSATDLAIWDGVLAFISASGTTGRCRRGERGLWVSARAHRFRISGRATRLGDLRGHRVSWFDGNEILGRLRMSTLHGRPHTVARWTAEDGQAFELGLLSGEFVYWLEPPDRGQERSTLKRASLSARGPDCRVLAPEANFDANSNRPHGRRWVAIDDTEVVHLNDRGVFATAPQPSRWRPCL
jgi:hypothetical protein